MCVVCVCGGTEEMREASSPIAEFFSSSSSSPLVEIKHMFLI